MKIVFSVFFTCYCGISFMMRDLFKKYYAQICITEHFFIEIMVNQEQIKRGGCWLSGVSPNKWMMGRGWTCSVSTVLFTTQR